MGVFASELSRCRTFKAIFGWIAVILAFLSFIVFPLLWIFKAPIPKTDIDFAKEYVYERFNFTPDTAYSAYHNEYQYIFPLYDETIKDELNYIVSNKVYQVFHLKKLKKIGEREYLAVGRLARLSCKSQCNLLFDDRVKVFLTRVKKHLFVVKEVK